MSLDVFLTETKPTEVFTQNITHNLGAMAKEAGIYKHLWRPEEIGITTAKDLIVPLADALVNLRIDPERFIKHNPTNGWGHYDTFVSFVQAYLLACIEYPEATVETCR